MKKKYNNLETFVNLHISILNQILSNANTNTNQKLEKNDDFLQKKTKKINSEFIRSLCDEFGLEK